MSSGENSDHNLIDDILHTHNGFAELFNDLVSRFAEFLHGLNVIGLFGHRIGLFEMVR
jgi:hypothetical protein